MGKQVKGICCHGHLGTQFSKKKTRFHVLPVCIYSSFRFRDIVNSCLYHHHLAKLSLPIFKLLITITCEKFTYTMVCRKSIKPTYHSMINHFPCQQCTSICNLGSKQPIGSISLTKCILTQWYEISFFIYLFFNWHLWFTLTRSQWLLLLYIKLIPFKL